MTLFQVPLGDACPVHVIPSGLVITLYVPVSPTATNCVPDHVTLAQTNALGAVCPVQVIPSGLVIT